MYGLAMNRTISLSGHLSDIDEMNDIDIRVSKRRDVPGQSRKGRPVVPLSWDKKVSLSRCPFVPGQKKFPCPDFPLFRDKSSSKNPGTNFPVPGQKNVKKRQKKFYFFSKIVMFLLFFSFCPVAVPGYSVTGQAVKIPSRGKMSEFRLVPVCPVAKCQNPVLARPVKRF